MPIQGALPIGESAEEGRALLQVRVALFWNGMMRRPSALKPLRGGHAGEVNLRRGAHPANIRLCTQASARIWWLEHRLALDDKGADSAPDTGAMRTIAVDAAPRSPANEVREPTIS